MHEPRPRGILSLGGELTEEDSAAVEQLARRLTNLKNISGVQSLRMVRALPDGGYVIAQDMGGIFKTITHKTTPENDGVSFDGVAKTSVPMLFSGVITKAVLVGNEDSVDIRITRQTLSRLNAYSEEGKLTQNEISLQRFCIDYQSQFPEFATIGAARHTQYSQQRPTWYSGAMAKVIQIVGGYGRQDFSELPDDPYERAMLKIPDHVAKLIEEEVGNVRLPGYRGMPPISGQFQYDYKFHATQGVAFDNDGKPWLIRINNQGVIAMPLPMIPATTTAAFRSWIEEVGDDEILKILDEFGGMPSGEGLPENIQAWRRAGVIIRVCDTADFYQHVSYATSVGWSFNSSGSEGFNTCFNYYDDEGLGYGMAYKLKLNIGTAENDGKLPQSFDIGSAEGRILDGYLSQLYALMTANEPKHLAIKYKLRRVPVEDILARAGESGIDAQREIDYWDGLELDPIAQHSGSITRVGIGYLYHGADFQFQPQIKFPEPFEGGCISHDFLPMLHGRGKGSYPNCDTIMFGYYVGDSLKVVKYFREGRSYFRDEESDFDNCMTVGSWEKTSTSGVTTIQGHFYTSDVDERDTISESLEVTKIKGTDRGYSSSPEWGFDDIFSSVGSLSRRRYYSHEVNSHLSENNSLDVGVCIPYFNRNSVLHGRRITTSGEIWSDSVSLSSVMDPNTYRIYTYDKIWHWVGGSTAGNVTSLEPKDAEPQPVDGNPIWVLGYSHNPTECSDFADNGDWIGGLPHDISGSVASGGQTSGGGGAPKVRTYSNQTFGDGYNKGDMKFLIEENPRQISTETPDTGFFLGSPDQFTGIYYEDACQITIGNSFYWNVSDKKGLNATRYRAGYCSLVDHRSAHHFIGVINE